MLFNSIEYVIFLPLFFIGYWFIFKRLKLQNIFVVISSYIFYGWWDWRFLILIAFTTLCSYASGILIERQERRLIQRWICAANITLNLLVLCIFKYFNFFSENFVSLFETFGIKLDWVTLDILLPVGISFYTFQALSYTIDIYQHKMKPTHDMVAFFAFISFFPQLVAGPIERATNLLPQFLKVRTFDYGQAVDGMQQILYGLFKKMVIADNCSRLVDIVFSNYQQLGSIQLFLGAVFFTFQIYCDFSGYSDIAIGTAKLLGIKLMKNFDYPYISRNIAEFWRRWHISLTTWFRDYIYIPLGGSRVGKWKSVRNTFIIFLVSGFWHGANWTFICWGLFHALLFLPLLLTSSNRKYRGIVAEGKLLPSWKEAIQIGTTFFLVVIGWILFRAENMEQAIGYIGHYNLSSAGHWDSAPLPMVSPDEKVFIDLKEKISTLSERGVTIFFLPPPYCRSSFQNDSLAINRISESLKAIGFPYYLEPSGCVYPDSMFYDSRYHLIREGVVMHSRKIAGELKRTL